MAPGCKVETQARARAAVRAIGTNATPLLVRYLATREGTVAQILKSKWQSWTRRTASPDADLLRTRAVLGFRALGSLGHEASPRLRVLMANKDLAYDCARALGAMNAPGAFPALVARLDSTAPEGRSSGAAGLGEMGPAAAEAVPRLCKLLSGDKDETVRASAADAIGSIGPAEVALPALIEALEKDSAEGVRICAVCALARFPADANALAAIRQASANDTSAKVAGVAAMALHKGQ